MVRFEPYELFLAALDQLPHRAGTMEMVRDKMLFLDRETAESLMPMELSALCVRARDEGAVVTQYSEPIHAEVIVRMPR
jgi:hypothetical protein